MTAFTKENFTWDGMYLMYQGAFKYGSKPYKSWVNYLVKNVSIEEYIAVQTATSPIEAMEHFGFKARKKRHFPQAEGNYGLRNGFGIERSA